MENACFPDGLFSPLLTSENVGHDADPSQSRRAAALRLVFPLETLSSGAGREPLVCLSSFRAGLGLHSDLWLRSPLEQFSVIFAQIRISELLAKLSGREVPI